MIDKDSYSTEIRVRDIFNSLILMLAKLDVVSVDDAVIMYDWEADKLWKVRRGS